MPQPNTLPRPLATYYASLKEYAGFGASNEGATRNAFHKLLEEWAKPHGLSVLTEQTMRGKNDRSIRPDAVLRDPQWPLPRGLWEAKDIADDLDKAVSSKIASGYPLHNTLFENTLSATLYQDGRVIFTNLDIRNPDNMRELLDSFVKYQPEQIEEYHRAVARFKQDIPLLAQRLTELIEGAKKSNPGFRSAHAAFVQLCREALNPATTEAEVEDMLKQHILTERIFRSIFNNPDFVNRNVVAQELEKMVKSLTSRSFSRNEFLKSLDYFYRPIEAAASSVGSYDEKQQLLNHLYEQFFQAYSTRTADTHGIVYTPREIVQWMVNSVEKALHEEFGLSLASPGVHIIDPCVGTGTFIMELLRHIGGSALEQKYGGELHANEVLLLPYYIAAQNIEHEYYERTGTYEPFNGLCFVDTLDLTDEPQAILPGFAPENTEHIERQKGAPIRVVIGNPPYNVGQENENDNNKNRRHRIDGRVRDTYGKASRATLRSKLGDPYVKFYRWAADRLRGDDGVVCLVSNNSFLDQITFDGMRKHLLDDFTRIYVFDLGGNVRKNPKLSGTKHNVFGIQVGVTIALLVRNTKHTDHKVFYTRVDEFWTKTQKLEHLETLGDSTKVDWQVLTPDARSTWLTEGMHADFDSFLPLGSRETKGAVAGDVESIFKTYSLGVATNRDEWVYDFSEEGLSAKLQHFMKNYNYEVFRLTQESIAPAQIDSFVNSESDFLKWTDRLKVALQKRRVIKFEEEKIRRSLYRPFSRKFLYFDHLLNQRRYQQHRIFPRANTEEENSVICVSTIGHRAPFTALVSKIIPCLTLNSTDGLQAFPFYTYNEDGTNRRENITDWALRQFQERYTDPTITKRDIFHYVYGVLHSPEYRQKYAENLKRDLPRIPFVPSQSFRAYAEAGEQLAALHRDYEQVEPYPLEKVEKPDVPFSWRVEKMKLNPEGTALLYNRSLTLAGIPPEVHKYRLGNRSALHWVVDQYRVSIDARTGIKSDPNDPSESQAIARLIGQVVRVSVDTVKIVSSLPGLGQEEIAIVEGGD